MPNRISKELDHQAFVNSQHDGHIERSQFQNPDFNTASALAVFDFLKRKHNIANREITVIDTGAGTGVLSVALNTIAGAEQISKNLKIVMVDCDASKLELGHDSGIEAHEAQLLEFDIKDVWDGKSDLVIMQRAVTQYFTGEDFSMEHPDEGFTPEQLLLYHKYLEAMPVGSTFIDIVSTGLDEPGLDTFQYILYRITDQEKKLNYVTAEETINEVNNLKSQEGKRFSLETAYTLVGRFGHRTITDLHKRYGNGTSLEEFSDKIISYYREATALFGESKMIEQFTNEKGSADLRIKLEYCVIAMSVVQ